mmetsp:Transcript_9984/g.28669  ORF Transcript_9984/g.28669 Transcript_9984/m.28669 type:complete len:953 (+) Transcript_9984:302-3160(+)|eukprot:CAMPEP_0117672926 /NCGR_PEP_ID=MMETSP0804-20121206/14186_1 /TAXON_ID=1074897 /ORGANISM="Tetraselmis astigmatica, Strain CCMP880" /LENGTH=952 /DNA_ID=CAMNT_0005481603 /DNA_START=211 /DNA_END=3069 /DNA_ORIENTATION=+
MASGGGWLRGVVKEIVSGDTLVIMGAVKGGPPPEKRITLSSLMAPRLGRRDGSSKDEPFAWQAREFLRKKAIGQSCVFRIDYTVEGIAREFGSVFIGQSNPPENLALSVVQAGWAKVRGGQQQSPYFEELTRAQEMAEQNSVGMFTKDPELLAGAVRELPTAENGQGLDAMALLASMGKGKPLPAIVEQVLNGTSLRVLLLPSFHSATVMVCGLQAPSMGRRNPENPEADPTPEPFARESRHFTEVRVLNREVRVVLEGVDKFNNLFGTVKFVVDEQPVDLGEQIVSQGLAKVVDWSLAMMTNGAMRLREGERAAKKARVAMWRDYVPPPSANAKLAGEFKGKVIEIVSGDTLIVKDPNGMEQRFSLASIRAPRLGRRDEKPEQFAVEAKEFMRKNIIGRVVNVKMEYDRKVGAGAKVEEPKPDAPAPQVMRFANVTYEDQGQDGQMKTKNIAEMLVERGLAVTQAHRSDDERSSHYEAYIEAENRAKKSKKGLQGNMDKAAVHRINDVSQGTGLKNAKQYLPFFTRGGRVPAVIDYVLSGHRFKLYSPKEGVQIAFSPSGVRTPNRAQPANIAMGKGPVAEEPFAQEAFAFVREHLMQRDVEVQVDSIDKGGTFLGTLFVPGMKPSPNFGVSMLQLGLAKLHPMFAASRVPGGPELQDAQEAAKQKCLKVWENYVEEGPAAEEEEENGTSNGAAHAAERVIVTEVSHGQRFFVQRLSEPRVAWLEEQLGKLALEGAPPVQGLPPKRGDLCIAQFSLDKRWYRAYADSVRGNTYDMVFVDFGNKESMPVERVRTMEPALSAVPAQALPCELAFLKVPALDSDNGMEAASYLAQLTSHGRPMDMTPVATDKPEGGKNPLASKPVLKVVLALARSEESSSSAAPKTVNEEMLAAGLAKLARSRGRLPQGDPELMTALEAAEDSAKKAHAGIWQYGDPGDSDEEEDRPRGAWGRR